MMNKCHIQPAFPFNAWDLDLLIDYVLKFHHRSIRTFGVQLADELNVLCEYHAEIKVIATILTDSVSDLDIHCQKEERILFPYILDLCKAAESGRPMAPFHCGTIQSPIQAMMIDHSNEIDRHEQIAKLTNNYQSPVDVDADFRRVMDNLRTFRDQLIEHTSVENEIIFPRAIALEEQCVER